MDKTNKNQREKVSRRGFLQTGLAAGVGATLAGCNTLSLNLAPTVAKGKKPNILFIMSDQMSLGAIQAYGCPDSHTPNVDRLVKNGVDFMLSYTSNPVCSPARSSMITGLMPCETGVTTNGIGINPSVQNMGQLLGANGYETLYSGKWHLPEPRPVEIPGFRNLLAPGAKSYGAFGDKVISRACEGYLRDRSSNSAPFLLIASLVQPHDICSKNRFIPLETNIPFPTLKEDFPTLPPNLHIRPEAPEEMDKRREIKPYSDEQWGYYRYLYYKQVEMVDAEIGRILDALDASPEKDNTIVIFTADHGDGAGRHCSVGKGNPYEEAALVPLIISIPGRTEPGYRDSTHLVSGVDIMSTVCECAGIKAPEHQTGRSLVPLLEQKRVPWRDYVVSEVQIIGRMVRSADFKYYKHGDSPVEMLFDMKNDIWETKNLYKDPKYADILLAHRKMLKEFNSKLVVVEAGETREKARVKKALNRTELRVERQNKRKTLNATE